MDKRLAELIKGKTDPMEIAKIVSRYRGKQARQKIVESGRKKFFNEMINDTQKLSMREMDALVWEYAMANVRLSMFEWLGMTHPEMFKVAENEVPLDAPVELEGQGDC